jgi:MOSC domain-containing protein
VLTTATIERLRELYPAGRFEVRRFRPNIVVSTGPDAQGFVENDWVDHTVAVGGEVRLRITGPCPRCVMTTLPQGDLPRDAGILRAAAQHNQANVGVYADVIAGGAIRRGDPVTLA